VIYVGAEQLASVAGPKVVPSGSRNVCVWQKNGTWWGPEVMGPVIG
jgi:hypothetical protein